LLVVVVVVVVVVVGAICSTILFKKLQNVMKTMGNDKTAQPPYHSG
jgi:predicted PurR-regulated permease PerM